MTEDDKYYVLNRGNLTQPIQLHLFQKQKSFSHYFCAFFKCTLDFEFFQEKMTLIAYVFPKLGTAKYVVR